MEFTIQSKKREEIIDITKQVKKVVAELLEKDKRRICNKKIESCFVYCPHTTCSIIINEFSDENIKEDILSALKKIVQKGEWKHDCQNGNADSHIKSTILGTSQTIPIENNQLALGTWQKIALADFDGPRKRKVIVKIFN